MADDDLGDSIRALVSARGTLALRGTPRASRARIVVEDGALRVYVTVPPEGGRANAEVLKLLSKALGLPKSALRIVAGETARDKVVAVDQDLPGRRM